MMHEKVNEICKIAKESKISMAEFVRRAIDAYSHNVPPEQYICKTEIVGDTKKDGTVENAKIVTRMPRTCLLKFHTEPPETCDGRWKLLIVKDNNILGFRYEVGLYYEYYRNRRTWVRDAYNPIPTAEIKGTILGWADLP